MILFLLGIAIVYVLTISWLIYGFTKINHFEYIGSSPKTSFSIIVPFRNEAENLPVLLENFSKLNYPTDLFEVILVDDFSSEEFQVSGFKFQVSVVKNIRVTNSPKKDAITTAMEIVKTDWIITTDADCMVPENWLLTLDNYIQLNPVSMVAGAVTYDCNNSFFQELKGFEGNSAIASGDDVFLLQKARSLYSEKAAYLKSKNTIVTTKPTNEWKSLFYQRVRWASKTTSYQSIFGKRLGLLVFMMNFGWIYCF